MDSGDQNTVTGGDIVISFALKTSNNVDLSMIYGFFFDAANNTACKMSVM